MNTSGDFIRLVFCPDPNQAHPIAQPLERPSVFALQVGKACSRVPPLRQPVHPAVYPVLNFALETNLHQVCFPPQGVLRVCRLRRYNTALEGSALFQEPFQALPYCPTVFLDIVELCFDEFDSGHSWPFPGALRRPAPDCTGCARVSEGKNLARFELQSCS